MTASKKPPLRYLPASIVNLLALLPKKDQNFIKTMLLLEEKLPTLSKKELNYLEELGLIAKIPDSNGYFVLYNTEYLRQSPMGIYMSPAFYAKCLLLSHKFFRIDFYEQRPNIDASENGLEHNDEVSQNSRTFFG